jgi:molybdenum cofactor cytidylyltransferase
MSAAAAGIVLAAGAGRRFGAATKQLAPLRGRPLLEHAVAAMLAVPALDAVYVVLGHKADEIRAAVALGRAEVVVCAGWESGQAASLRSGVAAAAAADAGAVVVTLGDQPFITPEAIAGAVDRLAGYDAVRVTYDGVPGHPVVLGPEVMEAVAGLRGDTGARELLSRFRVRKWEAGQLCSAADIDTQEELARL